MRARFLTSIASQDFGFTAGTEVSVVGTEFGPDTVPEVIGRQWLASGVLEPLTAALESAAVQTKSTAAFAAAKPRRPAGTRT